MPNKLTDTEIKKALEYRLKVDGGTRIDKEVLDLINRLQAENERLEKENKHYAELEQGCYVTGVKNIKAEAYKECIEKVKALFPSCNEPYQYWEIHEGADNLLKEMGVDGKEGET